MRKTSQALSILGTKCHPLDMAFIFIEKMRNHSLPVLLTPVPSFLETMCHYTDVSRIFTDEVTNHFSSMVPIRLLVANKREDDSEI